MSSDPLEIVFRPHESLYICMERYKFANTNVFEIRTFFIIELHDLLSLRDVCNSSLSQFNISTKYCLNEIIQCYL